MDIALDIYLQIYLKIFMVLSTMITNQDKKEMPMFSVANSKFSQSLGLTKSYLIIDTFYVSYKTQEERYIIVLSFLCSCRASHLLSYFFQSINV